MGSVKQTFRSVFQKFQRKGFVIRSFEEQNDRSVSGHDMHRVLSAFDLVILGIGCTIGAGIVVLTGVAAHDLAGPGVVLSYVFGGIAAMLTAFCYAEFAAAYPVAGGAFNYISLTYGEFIAWVAACDLILEYTLSAAAVAKGFTAYLASLIQVDLSFLRLQYGLLTFDLPALGSVVILSLVLMRSTQESSTFNVVMVSIHILLIIFVICAGFPFAKAENYTPFLPFGMRGVFSGASVIFFSFIGFDTVSTAAEECKRPSRDLPIGIIGSLGTCTVLYVLMCLVITGMQPYMDIDINAPFSVAFDAVGLHWARTVVALGALAGILTSLLGSLLGQARIYVVLGRQYLLPPWLARVSERSGTPVNAAKVTMITAGLLALLFDIDVLAELVSIGTLVVFAMVCSGIIFRRYWVRGEGEPLRPIGLRLVAVSVASIAFSISFTEGAPVAVPICMLALWAAATASFLMLPVRYVPETYRCPLCPWLPSLGMLCTLHLIGSLGWPAYLRWIIWLSLSTLVYLLYGLHRSQGEAQSKLSLIAGEGIVSSSHHELGRSMSDAWDSLPSSAHHPDGAGIDSETLEHMPLVGVTHGRQGIIQDVQLVGLRTETIL
ncbi:hypothetical protein CEUSTIGMA_g6227.t1 [Chlamydomonas eustigma]|uniref:Cationic amino acid transporter C-terminal domain-containing protein n=1 Tax=Chlamydomonas eustigma TaxID=1157962 RepID=A0A250X7Q2_9CHLO|nr:hypothetical protein CEUSTIGMA_g6227.t1 [Chlamydomonas eustigma]|eukprot:GAX78790.1 hypothetical protein CEUSTIGMA_g6227.t1 [Chlamydomonas eustigma]